MVVFEVLVVVIGDSVVVVDDFLFFLRNVSLFGTLFAFCIVVVAVLEILVDVEGAAILWSSVLNGNFIPHLNVVAVYGLTEDSARSVM